MTSDASGFTMKSDKDYGNKLPDFQPWLGVTDRYLDAGEEIFVSYGNHSNDFLLTECM